MNKKELIIEYYKTNNVAYWADNRYSKEYVAWLERKVLKALSSIIDCTFVVGDIVTAFNNTEWSNTGDLPEGNGKYYQEATILKLRTSKAGESIADIIFKSGKKSNGHFLSTLELSTADKSKKALYIHSVSRCDPFG